MTRLLESLGLALDIVKGSFRLLKMYPILIVPLLPVFIMVFGLEFVFIFYPQDLIPSLVLIFVVAFELMFSFAITGNMIHQIHNGEKPSLGKAITSTDTVRIIPKVLLVSMVWFTLIAIIVAIELAISALLSRGKDGGEKATRFINSIFGTLADALRMMGFMMIPIMIFEGVGVPQGFKRLRSILTDNPILALGGLALTKFATAIIGIIITGLNQIPEVVGIGGYLLVLFALGLGWVLSMYLEQIFVTGLFLYSTYPESKVVEVLLEKHMGRELPRLPLPDVAEQPLTP